jgi:putative protease
MPSIDKEGKNDVAITGNNVLVNSLGQTQNGDKKYYADYRLNVFNSHSLDTLKNFSCVTLSPELSIKEIKAIKKPVDTELIVYGRIPLMTFENCPVRAHSKCDNGKSYNELVDRMNEKFVLMCGEGCFSELLNSKPIYMADKLYDLMDLGIKFFRLDFTVEKEEECEKIIEEYQNALFGKKANSAKENTFTRGHFYKKVD